MKKVYKLEDLDCAHCATKMQDAVAKIDGVKGVSVNFLMQKFSLEAADDVFEDVLNQALKVCKKIEPDCKIIVK